MPRPATTLGRFVAISLALALPGSAWANPGPTPGVWSGWGQTLAARPLPTLSAPAAPVAATPSPDDCRAAVAAAERAAGIPAKLLAAIARVESGRYDPATGRTSPWPWTINAEGEPGVFPSKQAAIAAVRAKQAAGVASIDVGCLQVNLMHHPRAFASLEQAFDPFANASYAARFLAELHAQSGDWAAATARYHSATPELGAAYQRKVAAIWQQEPAQATAGAAPPTPPALTQPTPGAIAAGFLPPSPADNARIIPLAPGAAPGRGLAAYRLTPVAVISRPGG